MSPPTHIYIGPHSDMPQLLFNYCVRISKALLIISGHIVTSHTLLAISYGRVILYGGCGLALKQDKFLITIGLHIHQTINHTKCCLYLCIIRKLIELKHLRCGLMYSTLPHAINCSLYNHALLVT